MADRKVSELNAATAGNLHDDALLMAVDPTEVVDADKNVRATIAQARTAILSEGSVTADALDSAAVGGNPLFAPAETYTTLALTTVATTALVPAGIWMAYVAYGIDGAPLASEVSVQALINDTWRALNPDLSNVPFVISDGARVRFQLEGTDALNVYLWRINP